MMMRSLTTVLEIRPGEGRMVALVGLLFTVVQLGWSVSGSAADALFFEYFGVNNLPYMYIALGILNFSALVGYAAFLGRWSKGHFFTGLFFLFGGILLAERFALFLNLPELYAVLWLTINLMGLLLATLLWSVAGEICDARQAKRLFPLFVSAGVLGWLVGSLLTGTLAHLFGTANLIALDSALLLGAIFIMRAIARNFFPPAQPGRVQTNFAVELGAGFDFVRRSPMLQLLSLVALLFSILFFSLTFPFGKAVAASFSNEADMAGFLGLFSGVGSAVTLVVSLLLANRLYARIGLVNGLLLLPITYMLGFVAMVANFSLVTASAARFSQSVMLNGIGDGAYNTLFNVVPPEKRAQVRAFEAGVPTQLGIVLSGILLLLASQILTTLQIFVMGIVVALVTIAVVWSMRRRYADALVAALRAGRYEAFTHSDGALRGFQGDAAANAVVISSLNDANPVTRRLAAEMLGRMGAVSAAPALIAALDDLDTETRAAAVHALGILRLQGTTEHVIKRLTDPQPLVRSAVLTALLTLPLPEPAQQLEFTAQLEALLEQDEPLLCVQTAGVLLALGHSPRAEATLTGLQDNENPTVRVQAVRVIGHLANNETRTQALIAMLQDEAPVVRRAACNALTMNHQTSSIEALISCLDDPDETVRAAASSALRHHESATPRLLQVLKQGRVHAQEGALLALSPQAATSSIELRAYAEQQLDDLQAARRLAVTIPLRGRATKMLRETLAARVHTNEQHLVRVLGLLGNRTTMELVGQSLQMRDAQIHAAAIEALETLGDKPLVKKFIPLLEDTQTTPPLISGEAAFSATILQLLSDNDNWICALAARSAGELRIQAALAQLQALTTHPDPLIRAAAQDARIEFGVEPKMKTLQTVSLMERILLLHQVPMFAELEPDDLEQIAEMAREQLYPDGAVVCREGEQGHELFVIVSGRMRVVKKNGTTETVLAHRETGEFFGEMAIVESAPRFATVSAEGEARVLSIEGNSFKTILHDRPEVSLRVIASLSRRLRESVNAQR